MTHRISGERADTQICEETIVKATDGAALKRLPQGNVWMSLPESNSDDISVPYLGELFQNKRDLILNDGILQSY